MTIFRDFVNFIENDWRDNRQLFLLENFGTISGLLAAGMIAFFQDQAPFLAIYFLFLVGNIALIIAGYVRNSAPLIVLNLGFMAINLFGIIKALWS